MNPPEWSAGIPRPLGRNSESCSLGPPAGRGTGLRSVRSVMRGPGSSVAARLYRMPECRRQGFIDGRFKCEDFGIPKSLPHLLGIGSLKACDALLQPLNTTPFLAVSQGRRFGLRRRDRRAIRFLPFEQGTSLIAPPDNIAEAVPSNRRRRLLAAQAWRCKAVRSPRQRKAFHPAADPTCACSKPRTIVLAPPNYSRARHGNTEEARGTVSGGSAVQ